jgi:hypothetical protein
LDPIYQGAGVSAIGPDQAESPEAGPEFGQYQPGAIPVLNIGGVHDNGQDEAHGIDHDMAFPAGDLLASIISAEPPFSVVLTL